MLELIKPGTKIDFMGRRRVFAAISGALVAASLIAVVIFGLNQGIDFKGGTKVIVSFKADQPVDRSAIKAAVDDMLATKLGLKGSQLEVQDFDVGETGGDEEPTRKFVLYTELTSLLSADRRDAIISAIKEKYGEETLVDTPEEGGDIFYIVFPNPTPITERQNELKALFAAAPFEYTDASVVSDREREIEVDYVREMNLLASEIDAAAEDGSGQTPESLLRSAFEERKAAMLADLQDTRYTVSLQELKAKFEATLGESFPDSFSTVESSTSVSASVGADLLADGLLAILYAIIGMLIYIALRFDMRYAPGAVVALVHDVSITVGLFAFLQVKFTLPIVAALLTIVGYSLNDTIVVFDRIRENAQKLGSRAFESVINVSINETLSRTLLTSITTLFVVVSILVLGGGLIRDFAFALFVGILVGTYSSVFIASPVALLMERFLDRQAGAQRKPAK